MKRCLILITALLFAANTLPALRPGDEAMELNVRFLQGAGRPLKHDGNERFPELKAVVFLMTRAANGAETVRLLAGLQRSCGNEVGITVITPDPMADAERFLQNFPELKTAFAVDEKRSVTANYMNGSLLYPMAFLIDGAGRIVWNGEAFDLAEAVERYRAGKLDPETQKKIAPMLDELQTLLRDVNERRTAYLVDSILRADPGNPTALRLRLFLLEHQGRAAEGFDLVSAEIRKSPELARLYFMALDLAMRHPELSGKISMIADQYDTAVAPNHDSDNLMAWTLLTRAPEESAALIAASRLVTRPAALGTAPPLPLQAAQLTTKALLAYRLGKVDEARNLQKEAVDLWQQAERKQEAEEARRRLEYYETVQKLR